MNEHQIPDVLARVEGSLTRKGALLKVAEEGYSLEDGWLYITLAPTSSGRRASDYADVMAEIEDELNQSGIENVLLVPTVPE